MRSAALITGLILGGIIGCFLFKGAVMQARHSQENLIPREVLFGNPDKITVRISPDGTKLAYIAPHNGILNVWVRTIGKQDDQVITSDANRGIRSYMWGYDNGSILYIQDKEGDENWLLYRTDIATKNTVCLTPYKDVHVQLLEYRKEFPDKIVIGLNKDDKRYHDAYILNLLSGDLELAAKNPGDVASWVADAQLQVRGAIKTLPDGSYEILIRKDTKSSWQTLLVWGFEDALLNMSSLLGFTKNGKAVYLKDCAGANATRLVRMDIASKKRTVVAADDVYDMDDLQVHPDTREPVLVTFAKERSYIQLLDKQYEDDLKAVRALDSGDIKITSYDNAFQNWMVAFIKDNGPIAYYVYHRPTKQGTFLFTSEPKLATYKLASVEPITFTSRDGLTIHGYLTKPTYTPSQDTPSMVLNVHGGPWHRDQWGFDANAQWFANRGMTCLQINYRGSTGYGKAFLNAGNKEWGRKMHDDLIDGVNWAIANGHADPKKIAIFGGSYGGYAALVGATFTPDTFCCAVDIVGPSNLLTFIKSVPDYWVVQLNRLKKLVGDPATESEMLKERSPLFKVANIKIPMLIAQGANDPRVKQAESEQIVAAMKAKGIPHEYMLFPDEGHGFAKPENRLKFSAQAEKFLSKHTGCRYQE